MKKKLKKIIQMITLFIIGTGGKTFASEQSVLYGPPQDTIKNDITENTNTSNSVNQSQNNTNIISNSTNQIKNNTLLNDTNQTEKNNTISSSTNQLEYDIADSNYIESESNFGFFSIIASIILFVIGVVAILNKKIKEIKKFL